MRWRLVKVSEDEAVDTDLTNAELIGVDILVKQGMGLPHSDDNVFYRAWNKLHGPASEACEMLE